MSVISEIELFSYPSLSSQEEEDIRKFLSKIEIVGLNTEIKETAIIFRRTHRSVLFLRKLESRLPLLRMDPRLKPRG